MRPPVDHIEIPAFPGKLTWINSPPLRIPDRSGQPLLVEFWDFCRPNSIRTLPYLGAWHERYVADGLRVVGIHASGFPPSQDGGAVTAAVARLGVRYPVVVDATLQIWVLFGNLGWPARYLFTGEGRLCDYHYGEGGYDETERAIQELLGVHRPLVAPIRPEDAPGAVLAPQSADVAGPYSGPYEAGGVWAVLEGDGAVTANGARVAVDHPGAYELVAHTHSTRGELALSVGDGVTCHAVCFTPGLAAD
jgi:thiol-disulfide isomerase/thioredoxin